MPLDRRRGRCRWNDRAVEADMLQPHFLFTSGAALNDMTMEIDWPVVYINTATNEPLRVITRDEWFGSLAANIRSLMSRPASISL